jgi:two-component system sensor histidine kinase UhpB
MPHVSTGGALIPWELFPNDGLWMTLSRYLMWRIAAVSAVILIVALLLALLQAQSNIAREERGAAQVARLLDELGGLESGPASDIAGHIAALQETNRSGQLRHLQLRLQDADGRVLVLPVDDEPAGRLEGWYVRLLDALHPRAAADPTVWALQRDDGRRFRATLLIDPASEQRESFDGIVGLMLILLGFAIVMVLAVYWMLRRALQPMDSILAAIGRYESNDYTHRLPPQKLRETNAIATALNHMATALERAQEIRRLLSSKMLTLQEDERAHLARDLHSGHETVALTQMLEDLLQSWRERPEQSIEFSLELDVNDAALNPALAVTLYRMTQEALTNAVRHADARHVDVSVCSDGLDHLVWRVRDDGNGIESTDRAMHQGNGLAGICERVWALRGDIDLRSNHDSQRGGFAIEARLPLGVGSVQMDG